jgi:hypothetical protein
MATILGSYDAGMTSVDLSQFSVDTESFGGGIALTHSYLLCDWQRWVEGDTLPEIIRQAIEHGAGCDGQPQPKPEPPARPAGTHFVPAAWAAEIEKALLRRTQEAMASEAGMS